MNLPGIPSSQNLLDKLAAALPDLAFPALESILADFASAFTQESRLFNLQIGDGKTYGNRLLPQSLEGREALSTSYRYEVTCLSPDAFIPLDGLLGLGAQLDILSGGGGLFEPGGEQLTRCGLITEAQALPSDGGFAKYKLIIESPLALLRHRRTSRVFQDLSVPDIVQTILDEHIAGNPAIGGILKTDFDLSKQYPERSYCLQYRETDLDFIERLLFEEGIGYRWSHESGDAATSKFIAFDDPNSLPQASQGKVRFHRAEATESADSLTEWREARRIGPSRASLRSYDYKPVRTDEVGCDTQAWEQTQGEDIQAETGLEDFDAQTLYYGTDAQELHRYAALRQEAHDRKKGGYRAQGNLRGLMAGEWFCLAEHPAFDKLPEEEREFTACALEFAAHNNLPQGLNSRLSLPFGKKSAEGESPKPYWVSLSARKRGLPLTPAFAHTRHAKPRAQGVQTATVTGPSDEEVYTDEMGRIKIQFHWQRPQEHPGFGANFDEGSSCWVRVAYPSAGVAWGHQSIPRIGQEVLVDFIEGDIDRPIITGAIHNGEQHNPWFSEAGRLPPNRTLSGIKSKEFYGQQYNEILFDDTEGQVRAKVSSEHGKTQLNQGFLTHPRQDGEAEPRGDGFELRTDRHGALRAAQGLLLSTEPKPEAWGRQLDRESAQAQLDAARKAAQILSDAAEQQGVQPLEIGPGTKTEEGQSGKNAARGHIDHFVEALRAWEAGTNTDPKGESAQPDQAGQQAILAVSGQDGMALSTPQELVVTAGMNLDTVSLRDTQQSTARRWVHNVGKKVSLFVHGIKDKASFLLTAATGHVQMHAQSGDVEVVGDKNVRIYANKQKLTVVAEEELLLTCGGGYIRLKGGNIEIHCPSNISYKSAGHSMSGPTSMNVAMPVMPIGEIPKDVIALEHVYHDGTPLAGAEYTLTLPDDTIIKGTLDSSGRAQVEVPPGVVFGTVEYGPMPTPWKVTDQTPNPSKGSVSSRIDSLIDKYAGEAIKKAEAEEGSQT